MSETIETGAPDDEDETEEALPLRMPLKRLSASLVRDWVRTTLVPEAVKRMHEIGMGQTTFDVPTMTGKVVQVPAPASVQQRALAAIIAIGVPPQVGITSEGAETPGVIAMGPVELDDARAEVHARYLPRIGGIEVPAGGAETPETYVPPPDHTVVEIDEHTSTHDDRRAEVPPPPPPRSKTLAQVILERRRAARRAASPPTHEATDAR